MAKVAVRIKFEGIWLRFCLEPGLNHYSQLDSLFKARISKDPFLKEARQRYSHIMFEIRDPDFDMDLRVMDEDDVLQHGQEVFLKLIPTLDPRAPSTPVNLKVDEVYSLSCRENITIPVSPTSVPLSQPTNVPSELSFLNEPSISVSLTEATALRREESFLIESSSIKLERPSSETELYEDCINSDTITESEELATISTFKLPDKLPDALADELKRADVLHPKSYSALVRIVANEFFNCTGRALLRRSETRFIVRAAMEKWPILNTKKGDPEATFRKKLIEHLKYRRWFNRRVADKSNDDQETAKKPRQESGSH